MGWPSEARPGGAAGEGTEAENGVNEVGPEGAWAVADLTRVGGWGGRGRAEFLYVRE